MTTTTAAKVANYTDEQTATLAAAYVGEARTKETVEAMALAMGKNTKSIIAKLSRMQIYLKPTYTTKTGEPSRKKCAHADAIGAVLQMSEPEIESLTKANKTALVKIFTALAKSKPIEDGLTEAEGKSLNRCTMETRRKVFEALELGAFGELQDSTDASESSADE